MWVLRRAEGLTQVAEGISPASGVWSTSSVALERRSLRGGDLEGALVALAGLAAGVLRPSFASSFQEALFVLDQHFLFCYSQQHVVEFTQNLRSVEKDPNPGREPHHRPVGDVMDWANERKVRHLCVLHNSARASDARRRAARAARAAGVVRVVRVPAPKPQSPSPTGDVHSW